MNTSQIHENFISPPFYSNNGLGYQISEQLKISNKPFYFESIQLFSKLTTIPLNSDELITTMIKEWKEESELITVYFKERNRKKALEPMIRGLANFISINTWINNCIINNLEHLIVDLDKLNIKPINLKERICFVLNQPDHYHSFIQLSGLYTEIEKLYYKQKITSSK